MRYKIYFTLLLVLSISCTQHQIIVFNDYQEGIEYSLLNNRKVLLIFDFLGNSNNSVQNNIFDKSLKKELSDFTIILLYVDAPDLAGIQNRRLQQTIFKSSFQPAYYIIDSNENIIKGPLGYCNKKELIDFINK